MNESNYTSFTRDLKYDYDVVLSEGLPALVLLGKSIRIPQLVELSYMPDPGASIFMNLPSQSSYNLPMFLGDSHTADDLPIDSFKMRLMQVVPRFILPIVIEYYHYYGYNDHVIYCLREGGFL